MASVTVKNKGGRRPELLFINQSLKVLPTPGAFALKNSNEKEKALERSFYLTKKKKINLAKLHMYSQTCIKRSPVNVRESASLIYCKLDLH